MNYRQLLASGLTLALGISLCAYGCDAPRGFECGSPLPSDPVVIRSCTGANQVCVCATRSCAVAVHVASSDGGGGAQAYDPCPSGLRYIDSPFARTPLACVEDADAVTKLSGGKTTCDGDSASSTTSTTASGQTTTSGESGSMATGSSSNIAASSATGGDGNP